MITLRKAIGFSVLLVLLFTTACGGAVSTEAPSVPEYNDYSPVATEAPAAMEAPDQSQAYPTQSISAVPQSSGQSPSSNEPYDMFFED